MTEAPRPLRPDTGYENDGVVPQNELLQFAGDVLLPLVSSAGFWMRLVAALTAKLGFANALATSSRVSLGEVESLPLQAASAMAAHEIRPSRALGTRRNMEGNASERSEL